MIYWLLVFSEPTELSEFDFNEWYDKQHIPDLLKIPGVIAARRLKASEAQFDVKDDLPGRYLAVYEIKTDSIESVFSEMKARVDTADMVMSEAINLDSIKTMVFRIL
ncbi:hypothetical protein [Paraburkholderia guartelaensis]|uniref:DUF4286 family protein n=1 Tax=Paraburkholderia guartelaensis TaxID=2546446 RepID=A0ABU9SDA4_9BURK